MAIATRIHRHLSSRETITTLGVMSGTSIDGVDYALCEVSPAGVRLKERWRAAFPAALRRRVLEAARGAMGVPAFAQLHHDLGRFYARHAREARNRPQLIGLHGQTVFHATGGGRPATFQAGEPAYMAEETGVPVVSNFRAADLAAGGLGAPLAPLFHRHVFARAGHHVCVNNLGGISNVTSIDWRKGGEPQVVAFDTGPGNLLIDLAMTRLSAGKRRMDRGGAWGAEGTVCDALVDRWLSHPFFRRPPPKSTGREQFGESYLEGLLSEPAAARLSPFDLIASLTDFTARSIALNYGRHLARLPDVVVLTGGGGANPLMVERIGARLREGSPAIEVRASPLLGWPLQSVEPAAFALLAYYRVRNMAYPFPRTTGARHPVLLGQITEPSNSSGFRSRRKER